MERFIVATDLDGTLFSSKTTISKYNLNTLKALDHRFVKVIATGRSFYSAYRRLPKVLSLDYLVSSSGAGIINWQNFDIENSYNLTIAEVKETVCLFKNLNLDFSIQRKAPNNHYFDYYMYSNNNSDFRYRLNLYKGYYKHINFNTYQFKEACQLIAITKGKNAVKLYETVKSSLPNLKVIRSTSPIDGESLWIEVYNKNVSKANGISFLANKYQIPKKNIVCIGNDYNDIDMLDWAGNSFVVNNAPNELKAKYRVVSSNDKDGFSEAIEVWKEMMHL